jgi:hypothetical protein
MHNLTLVAAAVPFFETYSVWTNAEVEGGKRSQVVRVPPDFAHTVPPFFSPAFFLCITFIAFIFITSSSPAIKKHWVV